jgi:hypothetical protein
MERWQKTALLQILVVSGIVRFANVLFVGWLFFSMKPNVGVSFEADLRVILCPHTDERRSGKPLLAYHCARF